MRSHLNHHARFYASFLFGVAVFLGLQLRGSPVAIVAAGDVFFVAYLVSAAFVAFRATPKGLRKYAAYDDEGIALIFLLTFGAIAVSLSAIFLLLRQTGPRDWMHFAVTLASVPLGWFTLHTLLAFRYAHIYYAPEETGEGKRGDAGGLNFHCDEEPAAFDFLYHSFVIGMTGGVSDIEVNSVAMRRLAMVHGVASFFFNTVILALTVNIAATLS
jgi:uncharacterized membrane protein